MNYAQIFKLFVFTALFAFVATIDLGVASSASELSNAPIPANVPDCVQLLKKTLPKETIDQFKLMSQGDSLEHYESSLGTWIRNNWIRAHNQEPLTLYFSNFGVHNPDYMSDIILCSLWRDLHNQPIKLDELLSKSRAAEVYDGSEIIEKRKVTDVIWNTPLESSAGKRFKLADFKGKKLVLALIWSDASSREVVTTLNEINKRPLQDSLEIVAIVCIPGTLDEADKRIIVSEFKPNFSVVLKAPAEFEAEIGKALIAPGLLEIPSTIVIGKDGIMTTRFNGWERDTGALLRQACSNTRKAYSTNSYSTLEKQLQHGAK